MKYQGYVVGETVRKLRHASHYTVDDVAELTGISVSSLNKLECGSRRLTMTTMYRLMDTYNCDANTILNIGVSENLDSIDSQLKRLPVDKREYLEKAFLFMIRQAA